ncbi:MAG: hypothetical protein EA369_08460 [Bradymonadales bacterium]|nr:MAG: hypothetical protein EA369_08460 [Bradymonadales bacterium]
MLNLPAFLTPEYYRMVQETSLVVVQACLVSFLAGLWIAIFSFRAAWVRKNSSLAYCGAFALLFALWNIFFLSSYAQRDLEIWNTSISTQFTYRLYLALGVLLPSVAHGLIRRIYQIRYFLPNSLHFWTGSLALLILFIPLPVAPALITSIYGLVSFALFSWINWRLWKKYLRAKDPYQKTRGLFLSLGLSLSLFFTFIGQIRAEGLSPIPLPYVGSTISAVFLYFVWQMLMNPRLREVRELMLGGIRVVLLTVVLGTIFLSLLVWVGDNDPELFLFNTFLAAFIILNVLEPIRDQLDSYIMRRFILDRNELERVITDTRRKIRSSRSTAALSSQVVSGLRKSNRVYRCGLYLLEGSSGRFRLLGKSNLGSAATVASDHPAAEFFRKHPEQHLQESDSPDAHHILKELRSHLGFPLYYDKELMGFLLLRTSLSASNPYTSFSQSEIALFWGLVHEISIVLSQLKHFEKQDQQQRFAALGEMSAALAHEIRNPLGAIQGATHLLASSPSIESSEDRECIQILSAEIERLQSTVDQYLRFARKSETKVPVNLRVLIEKSMITVKPKAQKTQTEIHWEPPSEDFFVKTDPLKLEQVLINLIINACEAFSKHISVEVSSSPSDPDMLQISIRDDGPGIPASVLPNIFTPLFTTKSAGSGLGLPICKKIIDSLGGRIFVESQVGKGSRFWIEMKRLVNKGPAEPEETKSG